MIRVILFLAWLIPIKAVLHADRWLVLPPRLELQSPRELDWTAADLARAAALYLQISRVSYIVPIAEAESCLKQEGLSMEQKLLPEDIARLARTCRSERALLMRVRRRSAELELTSKVYFRESDSVTDSLTTSGNDLLRVLGEHLSERFQSRPAMPKEASYDLIVAGDTFGANYFDWQKLKSFFLSSDSVKSAYCMLDANGTLHTRPLNTDKKQEKDFVDRLRFEGGFALQNPQGLLECIRKAQAETRREGRRAIVVFIVSADPQDNQSRLQLKAALRQIAQRDRLLLVVSSSATEAVDRFWAKAARELGENAEYLPSALRAKVGLANGQEWFIFRRAGRIYESRNAEPQRLEGGVIIPEKYAAFTSPQDLVKIYAQLSGNKVIASEAAISWNAPLTKKLPQFLQNPGETTGWRVLLEQNGVKYYLSLAPQHARQLKVGEFARVFVELLPGSARSMVRNRTLPALIIDKAHDSSPALEINVADFLRAPDRFLKKGIGGRSFWVMTGKVLSVQPPESDALDDGLWQ